MQKYRFVKFKHGKKWYAQSPHGAVASLNRAHALLFTDDDWQHWGEADGWLKEAVGEDQLLRQAGQPELPLGMED